MEKGENSNMAKRGNSEGSIYKMQDGRWRAAVSVGWRKNADGKKVWKRRVITAATRHEVADQMKTLLGDQQRGFNIDPGKQSVGDFLTRWLENTVKPSVRPKTYRSYEQIVRCHLAKNIPENEWESRRLDGVPGLGGVRLSKLTLQDVQRFFNEKLKAGNSPALVRYLRAVLRIALKEAVKGDLIARNVASLATPPKVEQREIIPFTPEQASRFLNAALGHRLEALFTAALAVGLRSGECSALRWEDVDLDSGTFTVRHTMQRVKGRGLVLMPPKSKKSRRTIELPAACVSMLQAHRDRQAQEKAWAGSRWIDTEHVFTSKIGTPIDDRKILKEFNALVKAAKLPKQRFHDLRHACISLLGAQGVPLKVIAEIVGHSDVRLTQNVYQHIYREAKRDAATRMEELLTSAMAKSVKMPVATTVATNTTSNVPN
jgi:integrase